jgi:hypothetical protein
MRNFLAKKEISSREAIGILFLVLLALFTPLLFFGKISLDGDTIMYTYPAAYLLQTFMDAPLNILSYGGYPVTVAFHIGFFSPIYRFFLSVFDFITAYHIIIFLDYVAAAFLTYHFVRNLGRGVCASLIAAVTFVLSQWGIYWMSSINISHTMYLLPALLLSVLKISERKWGYAFLATSVIGLNLTYTHYQFILTALLFAGIFMLYLAWPMVRRREGVVVKVLGVFALACIAGFALGLPQLVRTMEFLPLSDRSVFTADLSVWYFDLMRFLVPSFEISRSTQEFMPYIGIIPLFFVILALWKMRGGEWSKHGHFFAWSFAVVIVLTLKYSPLFFLLKNTPFLGHYFLQPSRFLYIGTFAAAVIAAFGFEYILANAAAVSDRLKKNLLRTMYALAGILALGNLAYLFLRKEILAFATNYFDTYKYSSTIGLPREYYHGLIEVMMDKAFSNVSLLNPGVLAFVFFSFSILLLLRIQSQKILFSNLALILIISNLLLVGMLGLRFGDKNILLEKPRFAAVIEEREKGNTDYRVFSYLVPFAQYQEILALHPDAHEDGYAFAREAFQGNLNFFSTIPIVGGYEPLSPRRYQGLMNFLNQVPRDLSPSGRNADIAQKLPLLSMMNAKYIVSPYELAHPQLQLISEQKVTSLQVPLYLYENRSVLPMRYTPRRVKYLKEGNIEENMKIVTEFAGSFADTAFIECNDCTADEKWVINTMTNIPGWKASADGKEARIYYANHAFMAVKGGEDSRWKYEGK